MCRWEVDCGSASMAPVCAMCAIYHKIYLAARESQWNHERCHSEEQSDEESQGQVLDSSRSLSLRQALSGAEGLSMTPSPPLWQVLYVPPQTLKVQCSSPTGRRRSRRLAGGCQDDDHMSKRCRFGVVDVGKKLLKSLTVFWTRKPKLKRVSYTISPSAWVPCPNAMSTAG